MKTIELTEHALNYAVILALTPRAFEDKPSIRDIVVRYPYCTNWSMSGPIIEREKIGTMYQYTKWRAWGGDDGEVSCVGPTSLIAAMRCYVASKLGYEIDIPEELK